MKMFERVTNAYSGVSLLGKEGVLVLVILAAATALDAQSASPVDLVQKVAQLTDAMTRTQARLESAQRDLEDMRRQLVDLQREMATEKTPVPEASSSPEEASSPAAAPDETSSSLNSTSATEDLRERVAMQESELATEEQTKVESESKYPVKITGMLLMNGFVNSGAVDAPATPSVAVGRQGSVGATMRQTILGFDASGPHLFGARTFADLRVDFYGSEAPSTIPNTTAGAAGGTVATNYTGYYNTNFSFLRLRTAHAGFQWDRTQLYFALDHPIISPDTPTSLTATALPALAWSGNLWTWNPQAVISQNLSSSSHTHLQIQTALIDASDAPLTPAVAPASTVTYLPPSSSEQSSRPGVEARIALVGPGRDDNLMQIGVGGYFAEHNTVLGRNYDSWASTLDARLPLIAHLELSGNFYRGAGLGGLGAGAYKDFAYSPNPNTGGYYFHPLDDVGGWAQLKARVTERLDFNAAFGMDNVFARQLRRYYLQTGSMIQNLAENRTFTGNVIYSPSAYLLFSLEYRHLESTPVQGTGAASNIIGIGAGYRF